MATTAKLGLRLAKASYIAMVSAGVTCCLVKPALAWQPPTQVNVILEGPYANPVPFFNALPDPGVRGDDGPDSDEIPNVFDKNPTLKVGSTFQTIYPVDNPLDPNAAPLDTARTSRSSQIPQAPQLGSDAVGPMTQETASTEEAKQEARNRGESAGVGTRPGSVSSVRAIPREVGRGFLRGFTSELPKVLGGTSDPATMTEGKDEIDPVNHGTGDFVLDRADLRLSGVGVPFELVRSYRSRWSYDGPMGWNWTHTYDQALHKSHTDCGETVITWQTGAAATIRFERNAFGAFESKPPSPYRLEYEPAVGYFIESRDGIRRYFDDDGLLAEIRDLNGNRLLFTWSRARSGETLTSANLLTVVDTVGRTINFIYDANEKLDRIDVPSLGQYVDYEIDANGDLVSARNAGGIVERYTYDSGHSNTRTIVPTAAVAPFCEDACGLSIDSCGGPCVDIAVDAEVSCMMACYDPNSCEERCDVACEEPCRNATAGTACLGECQDLCTRGCYWAPEQCETYVRSVPELRTAEMIDCLREHLDSGNYSACFALAPSYPVQIQNYFGCLRDQAWICDSQFSVPEQYASDSCYNRAEQTCAINAQPGNLPSCDQSHCEEACTNICEAHLVCEEYTSNVHFILSPSDSIGMAIQLALNWWINSRGDGPYYGHSWTNKGCKMLENCEPAFVIKSLGGGYGAYTYNPLPQRGILCNLDECLDCCLSGSDCPKNSAQGGATCIDHCREEWREECEEDLLWSCDQDCAQVCPDTCSASCQSTCSAECTRECRTKAPCHEVCGSIDYLGQCQTGCFDRCVEENTIFDASGAPITVYGNNEELNHNLLEIIDGKGRTYVTNTYETNAQSPMFDQITSQIFGSDIIRISSYDLENLGTVRAEDQYIVSNPPIALDLCPQFCTAFDSQGITQERWIAVGGGDFLIVPEFPFDPAVGAPFEGDPILDGFAWYEIRREGPGVSINPPIKLPAGGITIETRGGSLFLQSDDGYRGAVTYSGIDEPTADALFGDGRTLSLIHTLAGWRAYAGSAALLVQARGQGRCAAEFSVNYAAGVFSITPADACTGQLSFIEAGRRSASTYRALLTAPKQRLGYLFSEGRADPIYHNERTDPYGSEQVWDCLESGPIDPSPDCIGAASAQGSMGGPPGFDCGVPWSKRSGSGSPGMGTSPHPSAPDLSMDCGSVIGIPSPPEPRCIEWSFAGGGPVEQSWAQPYSRISIVRNVGALPSSDSVWVYYADNDGRILTVQNAAENFREDYEYDLEGRLTGQLSWFGNRRCMVYDQDWNEVQSVELPAVGKWAPVERIDRRMHFGRYSRPEIVFDPNSPSTVLMSYSWDSSGNLTAIHYPDPRDDILFGVDGRGRTETETRPNGLLIDYDYDPSTGLPSRLTRTAVATGESFVREMMYDANGNLTRNEEAGRPTEEYQYSPDGRLLSKIITLDPSGGSLPLATNYLYDDAGELEAELGPELDRFFSHTLRGLIERVDEDPHGPNPPRTTCMRYDVRGELVEIVDAEGRRTYFDRDGLGNVFRERRGIPVSSSPLAWDDVCTVRDGATIGEETFREVLYDHGFPATIRSGRNDSNAPLWVTSFDYDGYGRSFETRLANGTTTRAALDARGLPMFSAKYRTAPEPYPTGYVGWIPDMNDEELLALETFAFDHLGRPTQGRALAFIDEAAGRRFLTPDGWLSSSYDYDASTGRVVRTDAALQQFEGRSDAFGRPLQLLFHDAQSTVVDYEYFDRGRTMVERITPSSADGGRFQRTSSRTDFGAVRSLEIGAQVVTTIDYDDFGRAIYSDNRLERRFYRWNRFSELIGVDRVRANGTVETYLNYARNGLGSVSTVSDQLSGSITRSFDFANRLILEQFADQTYVELEYWRGTSAEKRKRDRVGNTVTTAYDDFGAPARIEGTNVAGGYAALGLSVITMTRGGLGLLSATAENRPGDASDDVTLTYVRDSLGRPAEEWSTLFPADPVLRTFDDLGRIVDTRIGSNTVHHDLDYFNRPTRVQLNNVDVATFAYHGHGGPTQITFGNNLIETNSYDDQLRKRTAVVPQRFGSELYYSDRGVLVRHDRWVGAGARSSRLYRHDELGRVLDAWTAGGLPTTGFDSGTITDQKLANWTSGATRNESYALNAADSWIGGTYGAQTLSISVSSTDQRYLTFNGSVETDGDGRTTKVPDGRQYSYDGLGRMLAARTAQSEEWAFQYDPFGRIVGWAAPAGTTKLQYAGDAFIREVSGTVQTIHVLNDDGVPLAVVRGSSKNYNHSSYGGRLDFATSSSGNIAERYDFSAYARVAFTNPQNQAISTSAIGNRFIFTGQPYFPELSMYRLGHRFYLPEQGRFTTPDAFGFIDGPNVHAYASAQPIAYVDPAGFDKSGSVAHEVGSGWGRWVGENTGNTLRHQAETFIGGGPASLALHGYRLWKTFSVISEAQKRDGLLGGVNALNPAYGALTNGYETKLAVEEGRVADATYHGLQTAGKVLTTVMTAVAITQAGSGAISSARAASSGPSQRAMASDRGSGGPSFLNLGDPARGSIVGNAVRTGDGFALSTGERVAAGTYDFVVQNGDLRIGRGHYALSGGNPVQYAGGMTFGERGVLLEWTNGSGHFRPSSAFAGNAGLPMELFRRIDFPAMVGGPQLPIFRGP